MPYCQLYYHIITATRNCEPLLSPPVEKEIFQFIRMKVHQLGGELYAFNGTEDHIHLALSIPPSTAVSEFVRQIKGYSSSRYNKSSSSLELFSWQQEYGVFSFDKKRLPSIIAYIERQKEHHREGNLISTLERCEQDTREVSDEAGEYVIPEDIGL